MDPVLADGARQLFADDLFETIRRCYNEANKEYLQKQINIAKEYFTKDQKEWLDERLANDIRSGEKSPYQNNQ